MVGISSSKDNLVVSWSHDLSGGVDAFHVERRYATGLVDWAPLTIVPAGPETSYSIIDRDDPGDGVQYRVCANGMHGISEWAESELYTSADDTSVPSAPTNVSATAASMIRL